MDKDSRIEQQIRHFYDSVPNVDDALPLKEHLLKHEDSRMAWYLLGKQYEGQGQQAKAAYCFGQAGEIYEAFEDKPAPKLPDERSEVRRSRKSRGAGWFIGSALILALAGLAILLFENFSPAEGGAGAVADERGQSTGKTISIVRTSGAIQPKTPEYGIGAPDVIAGISELDGDGRKQLKEFLTGYNPSQRVLVVRSPKVGKWTDWIKSGKPVASLTREGDESKAEIMWYDPKWCVCIPHESKAVQTGMRGWKPLQEEKLLLSSAMLRYRQRTGKWTDTPESLAGAYPRNTMAGWTEAMTAWFHELKTVKERKPSANAGWPSSSGPAEGGGTPAASSAK
ncbi:hypothetical protein SD71_04365 [Cohnella kolymensis]|uniref:Uncharacterized protein n=1 Tax=Cohnella kolymensis TaxID=1590652 RepID=A0ABR5A7S7_9BACL|nr:hypothetical protein [Cohnella kolymensis]KIL36952.1 hypothetical protein SD71_04365 [Cohnella kolymensis]